MLVLSTAILSRAGTTELRVFLSSTPMLLRAMPITTVVLKLACSIPAPLLRGVTYGSDKRDTAKSVLPMAVAIMLLKLLQECAEARPAINCPKLTALDCLPTSIALN